MKKSSKEKLRERMSENGKRSAAKRTKEYYLKLSAQGNAVRWSEYRKRAKIAVK